MWISLLMLLLLLVTPISCRAEIRQEQGTRFRILLRIWGIPLRFDHSQAPMRPKPPSAQQLQKGKALLRALPKLKRPVLPADAPNRAGAAARPRLHRPARSGGDGADDGVPAADSAADSGELP